MIYLFKTGTLISTDPLIDFIFWSGYGYDGVLVWEWTREEVFDHTEIWGPII